MRGFGLGVLFSKSNDGSIFYAAKLNRDKNAEKIRKQSAVVLGEAVELYRKALTSLSSEKESDKARLRIKYLNALSAQVYSLNSELDSDDEMTLKLANLLKAEVELPIIELPEGENFEVRVLAPALENIGIAHTRFSKGDIGTAIKNLHESAELWKKHNEMERYGSTLRGLASAYYASGEIGAARDAALQATTLIERNGRRVDREQAALSHGRFVRWREILQEPSATNGEQK
jgi:tetratricopeptide (TPR) repeat protein